MKAFFVFVLSGLVSWQTFSMEGFSYPHREFVGTSNSLFDEVSSGSINTLDQLVNRIDSLDRSKMKDVEFNTVAVRVLWRVSGTPSLCERFGKKQLVDKMIPYAGEAAKNGSIRIFPMICSIAGDGVASVCSRAMRLMLTNELRDCVLVKQEVLSAFPSNSEEKLREIFGVDANIPDDYPEDDRGRFRPSPVPFSFSKENIRRLELFLANNSSDDAKITELLNGALQKWEKMAE